MTPMPAKIATARPSNARSAFQNGGRTATAATTMSIRHQTRSNAGRLINRPKIAVKPHSTTQK